MRVDVSKIKEQLRELCASHTLFPINEINVKEVLRDLTSLFFEFKDSTRTLDYTSNNIKGTIVQKISPLYYKTVIESDENKEFLETLLSIIPYYYLEPTDVIESSGETILLDTRDLSINDVPAALQDNPFYQTWFRDSWGYIQNNLILDTYNKLQYPFITENQYINSTLFPNLADEIFNKSKEEDSYIGFMNTEEENNSVYKENYEYYGEEIGCIDYLEDIVNQKILSNYKLIDYTNKQNVLIQKWGESLFQSGQLNSEEVDVAKTIFKLQDIKNELIRRKFSGSKTLYSLTIASIDRQGSFISTVKAHDLPGDIYKDKDDTFNNKRVIKILRIPGILSKFYNFSDSMGIDIINTYFEEDKSIPLNTLVPLFYTSSTQNTEGASKLTIGGEFNNEAFYSNYSISANNIRIYLSTGDCGLSEYRDFFLRDNSNTVNWNSLQGIISNKNIDRRYKTLDEILLPGTRIDKYVDPQTGEITYKEVPNYRTLDSIYEIDDKPFRLDLFSDKMNLDTISGSVADLSIDKLLYHQNALQEELGSSYPYVTSSIANKNSISLMDLPWMNYVNSEIKEKSKIQDNTEVGCQLNTAIDLGNNNNTTDYNFFGISYTNENYLTVDDLNDPNYADKILQEWNGQKYALLWYCTLQYNDQFAVKNFTKQLISKITLKLDEKYIDRKYKDFDGEKYILKEEYLNYSLINMGILPLTYPITSQTSSTSTEKQIIWSTEIGFTTSLSSFNTDETYYVKEGENYREITKEEREKGPQPQITYYIHYDDERSSVYQTVHDFYDDTNSLGYSKAMFLFSDYDIITNSSDSSKDVLTTRDDGKIEVNPKLERCFVNPTKDTKYVYFIIKKIEKTEYRLAKPAEEKTTESEDDKTYYYKYSSDGTATIESLSKDKYYWSSPIRVVTLTNKILTVNNFEPDWYGLNYHLNPQLNFTPNTASALRKKRVLGNFLYEKLTDEAKKLGWKDGIITGASSYTSLCNLTRMRSLDFTCNDKGEFPTEWVKDYYGEHVAKSIYGLFLKRYRPSIGEVQSSNSNAEYSSIFGDNRYQDAFDSTYSSVIRKENITIQTPPPEGFDRPGDPTALYIIYYNEQWPIEKERGTSKYYNWVETPLSEGKFEEIDLTITSSERSGIFTDNIANLKGLSIIPNLSSIPESKWYKNYLKILPCDFEKPEFSTKEAQKIALDNWYWNKESDGKTVCLNILFYNSSLYTTDTIDTVVYYKSRNSLLISDSNFKLYLKARGNQTLESPDFDYSFVLYFGDIEKAEQDEKEGKQSNLYLIESDPIPLTSLLNMNYRVSFSTIKKETGKYTLNLCVNNNLYTYDKEDITYTALPSKGIDLFCKYRENEEEGKIIENEGTELEKRYEQVDCFYGTIYDLRLYNKAKSLLNLYLINSSSIRELFSNSPDNYKIASSLYQDLATIRRIDSTLAAGEISEVEAIRVFNRSIWDSILIDSYPVSEEERDINSPQYVEDYTNPYWDTDIYEEKDNTYYLKDCVEQDLIDNLEVYNGRTIIDNSNYKQVIIKYSNKEIKLTDRSYMTIISSLIEPISYNDDVIKSKNLEFILRKDIISQHIETDETKGYTDNYIIIPKQIDSEDDYIEYSTDINFNFLMDIDSDLSKWLSKGSNICLTYSEALEKPVARLSDNTIFDSSLNNIIIPLVIPKQDYKGNNFGLLDKFYIKDCLLSNTFSTFLNSNSYYNEIQIPVAKQKMVNSYNKIDNTVYTKTSDSVPDINKVYYAVKENSEKSFTNVYTYYENIVIYKLKEGKTKVTPENMEVFYGEEFERGVQYYRYSTKFIKYVLFNKDSLYYKNINGTRYPTNIDKLNRYNNYDEAKLVKFTYLDFEAGKDYYKKDIKYTELYSYKSDKQIEYFNTETNNWLPFNDLFFDDDVRYRYSGETSEWSFDYFTTYYKKFKVTEDSEDYSYTVYINGSYNKTCTFCTGSTIYVKVDELHPISGKTYYTADKKEYVVSTTQEGITKGTKFYSANGYVYYEDILTKDTYYYTEDEGITYKLTNEEHPEITTFKDWNYIMRTNLYTKSSSLNSIYYSKWDALRILKEGTYYFTCKYPIEIIPFSDDQLDSSLNLNYTTYYASSRFKVVVRGYEHEYEDTNSIIGYPSKYYSSIIESTLKSSDHKLNPEDNLSYPHRDIFIDLYIMDCDETAGQMLESGTIENYSFRWELVGSNHVDNLTESSEIKYPGTDWQSGISFMPLGDTENSLGSGYSTEDKTLIAVLNRESVENNILLRKPIPFFLSKNYTSSFFVAMKEKGSIVANPESADDDLIEPIKINLEYGKGVIIEYQKLIRTDIMYNTKEYASDSKGTAISQDIISSVIPEEGMSVEKFISITSSIGITEVYQKNSYSEKITSDSESDMDNQLLNAGKSYKIVFDYTGKVSELSYTSNYYNSTIIEEDEKVNYSRLVNLLDNETLNTSEYMYNTDGTAYISSGVEILNRNSGFDTTYGEFTSIGEVSEDNQYHFGNPYSKSSNKNYLLKIRNTTLDNTSSLKRIDSRQNINNSYNYPYITKDVEDIHIIPAVIETLGTIQNGKGLYKEIPFNEASVLKTQYTFLKDIVLQSIGDIKTSSAGLFNGFTTIYPHIIPPKPEETEEEIVFKDTIDINNESHELYGYYASSRKLPIKNTNIYIERKNLYSNNILNNNAFDNQSDWYLGSKEDSLENIFTCGYIPDDTWGSGKDVYKISYKGLEDGTKDNAESPLILKYLTGDLAIKSQYESAINIKTTDEIKVNIVYTLKGIDVARKELKITEYSKSSEKTTKFTPDTWLVYSTETEVTSEESENILSDGMYFEFICKEIQDLYITKAVIRKCNTTSHYLGLSNTLSSSSLTASVNLLSHRMILLKDKATEEYIPIQFENDILKTVSSNGKTVLRPRPGSYKIGEFINSYTLETYGNNSRVVKLLEPWVRRLHYIQNSGDYSIEMNAYTIKFNSMGLREKKEVYNNTFDIFKTDKIVINNVDMLDYSHVYLEIKSLPVLIDSKKVLTAYGMNLAIKDTDPIKFVDETFTSLFNCFNPVKYRKGINYPIAVTNIQLLNNKEVSENTPSYLKRNIVYELEYLPVVYSELNNHLSLNILLYKDNVNET